jgi:alpha-beta hydrolase superfamily lysophospholipase
MHEVKEEEGRITASDGVDLYCKSWFPDTESCADRTLVVYTHGIESHSGWFSETGSRLAAAGHVAVSVDRRGCGRSAGPTGHMDSFLQILADLEKVAFSQKEKWKPRKTIGIGLSLGGLFMTALSMRHPDLLDGVVGLVPAITSPLKFPKLKVLEMLFASALKPRKLYPIPIRVEMFTGQEEALAFIRDDRLRLTHASARFFWSLLCMRRWVTTHPDKMTKPLLTLLAEKDEIIDNRGVREWLERIPPTLSKTVEYAGVKHSILFEPCRDRVLKDIEEFMGRVESPCKI